MEKLQKTPELILTPFFLNYYSERLKTSPKETLEMNTKKKIEKLNVEKTQTKCQSPPIKEFDKYFYKKKSKPYNYDPNKTEKITIKIESEKNKYFSTSNLDLKIKSNNLFYFLLSTFKKLLNSQRKNSLKMKHS